MGLKIGLIDVDSHARIKKWGAAVYPNLALCKIAAYHQSIGDTVDWYNPLHIGRFDKVYVSKVFNFTPDYPYFIDADEVVRGGTGYDYSVQLPLEIDSCQPDLSIYPSVPTDTSYGFLSRGCPNKCKWCIVPKKEGSVTPYWDIEKVANGKKKVLLMDNNILAAGDYCTEQLQKIIDLGLRVDFNQALDARLINEDNARLLGRIKWLNRTVRMGCDTHAQIEECRKAMDLMQDNGFNGVFFLYTIIQGDINECHDRINYWRLELIKHRAANSQMGIGYNAYPFAQPFRDLYRKNVLPQWQKDMAQWVNKKSLFCSMEFTDFKPRKDFKCSSYFE